VDIDKITNEPVICPDCKNKDYLEEIVACSECKNPVKADIFSVDLKVERAVENANSKKSKTSLIITSYSNPKGIPPKFLEENDKGMCIAHPLDLPKIYGPDSIEVQEELIRALDGGSAYRR
jgi:hypothetical protein